jgi:hypothetical protein
MDFGISSDRVIVLKGKRETQAVNFTIPGACLQCSIPCLAGQGGYWGSSNLADIAAGVFFISTLMQSLHI